MRDKNNMTKRHKYQLYRITIRSYKIHEKYTQILKKTPKNCKMNIIVLKKCNTKVSFLRLLMCETNFRDRKTTL